MAKKSTMPKLPDPAHCNAYRAAVPSSTSLSQEAHSKPYPGGNKCDKMKSAAAALTSRKSLTAAAFSGFAVNARKPTARPALWPCSGRCPTFLTALPGHCRWSFMLGHTPSHAPETRVMLRESAGNGSVGVGRSAPCGPHAALMARSRYRRCRRTSVDYPPDLLRTISVFVCTRSE